MKIIDLFAGPGGWDIAALELGIDVLGVEFDDAACATRHAAGLRTLQGDVGALDPLDVAAEMSAIDGVPVTGLIASPPCQAFSMAGKGEGRKAIDTYINVIQQWGRTGDTRLDREALAKECADERAHLVLEPLRWAAALDPDWIALEQVEPVLPIWQAMSQVLMDWGHYTWSGVLSAEQYGVPQTRRRAFLIARKREFGIVNMPKPTHQRYIAPRIKSHDRQEDSLFDAGERTRIVHPDDRGLLPWVSMAEALGWGEGNVRTNNFSAVARDPDGKRSKAGSVPYERPTAEPAPTIDTSAGGWKVGFPRQSDSDASIEIDGTEYRERDLRDADEPAQAVTEKARSWQKFSLRAGTNENDAERTADEPAPTMRFGERLNAVNWQHPDWTEDRPSPTVVTTRRSKDGALIGRQLPEGEGENVGGKNWIDGRPATTVVGSFRPDVISPPGYRKAGDGPRQNQPGAVRVTQQEAAILQSFPADYPWQGSKTKQFQQIGNAVPPLLALAVLEAVVPAVAEAEAAA